MPKLIDLDYEPPPNLARFVGPKVPKDAKMMAARGMLPLPPRDLAVVLFCLTREEDAELRKASAASLIKIPENILKGICEDKASHPLILDFLARRLPQESPLLDAVALNVSTHDETIVFLAGILRKELVEIISSNQSRILRCPAIVDALAENTLTGQAALDRILKFVEMETRKSGKGAAPPPPAVQAGPEEAAEEAPEPEIDAVTEPAADDIAAVTEDDESPWAAMTFDEDLLRDHKTETEQEEEEVEHNLTRKIADMKVSEKIKLAMSGGSSARAILIKDSNKIVSSSVLKSPRITDNEIESISRSRSVTDEVIRIIAGNRDWTKNYQIKLNLVQHPKTPMADSMRFMNHLRDKDLRDIARSRNVPSQIATQAKRMIQRKEQKSKPGAKH